MSKKCPFKVGDRLHRTESDYYADVVAVSKLKDQMYVVTDSGVEYWTNRFDWFVLHSSKKKKSEAVKLTPFEVGDWVRHKNLGWYAEVIGVALDMTLTLRHTDDTGTHVDTYSRFGLLELVDPPKKGLAEECSLTQALAMADEAKDIYNKIKDKAKPADYGKAYEQADVVPPRTYKGLDGFGEEIPTVGPPGREIVKPGFRREQGLGIQGGGFTLKEQATKERWKPLYKNQFCWKCGHDRGCMCPPKENK
jgi:hypothetical protein